MQTDFGSLSAARKTVWATDVTKQGRDQNFWMSNGFVGSNTADMSRPVHRITELTPTERGDVAVMQLVADLQGDGVVGDNMLEGNEEPLVNDAQEIRIDQLRHGVRSKGKMSEQRTVLRFRSNARDTLSFWLANIIDEMMFLVAAGRGFNKTTGGADRDPNSQLPSIAFAADIKAATSGRIMYAGAATSEGDIGAADVVNWNLIVTACAYAKRKRLKPIRSRGKPYYAICLSTEQMRDLKKDPTYQTNVGRAGPRGDNNVLFQNAIAVIDGVILYEHQKTYNTLDAAGGSKWGAGGNIDGAQAIMMGAQALGLAQLGNAAWGESDNTDYNNRPAIAYGRILGLLKPQYKSRYDNNTKQDFGIISIKTAAAQTAQ